MGYLVACAIGHDMKISVLFRIFMVLYSPVSSLFLKIDDTYVYRSCVLV